MTREWNGLIKSVLDGEADMIVTALQITPERTDIIDFSVPYLETGVSILVAVRDGVISPTAFLGKQFNTARSLCLLYNTVMETSTRNEIFLVISVIGV